MGKVAHKIIGPTVALAVAFSGTTVDSDQLPPSKTPEQRLLETAAGTYDFLMLLILPHWKSARNP